MVGTPNRHRHLGGDGVARGQGRTHRWVAKS